MRWTSGSKALVATGLLIGVLVALIAAHPWTRGGDAREYPHPDGDLYVSGGSFEHDLLPRFQLALPCGVDQLRWGDVEDLVGTAGQLFVKFSASADCLGRFVAANHLESTVSKSFPDVPARYGWSIDVGAAFYTNQTERNAATAAVVATDEPTVYVAVEHE